MKPSVRQGRPRATALKYFKSEALGTGTDGPVTIEDVPYAGVRIERDRYNVPHVYADTYEGGVFAAGWIAAEDRGLLLQQARYNGRAAAIDVPGMSAIGLILSLQNFEPSAATEAQVATQTDACSAPARRVARSCATSTSTLKGINAYLERARARRTTRWTRNDI